MSRSTASLKANAAAEVPYIVYGATNTPQRLWSKEFVVYLQLATVIS
ncbi:MAG: hypothetical protein U0936_25575 [Planctomycetaceae bacterium]